MITDEKSNWGKYLLLGMASFMLFIIVLVFMMFKQPADDFDPRYYEHGLNYDTEFTKERNVLVDKVEPFIKTTVDGCTIDFKGNVTGTITFARPSDKKMDRGFIVNNNSHFITPANIATGKWQLTINWKQNGKEYLHKKDIYIP
ncbi:nitrogen fixation protein FixH [Mucilaginibacter limnophilus]|uniref:Nitrogen fixation protein FixH n=1 Tax=Mucilaginibacter limnophilus TaxID=1932778 RepID=A0A437MZ04_9SPHI|nr:FixH family protein [Mucilaginibacter limnophilus]RVU02846.1 nitrogen fixation protein FixH [Mucilaginibacter limnophilus]